MIAVIGHLRPICLKCLAAYWGGNSSKFDRERLEKTVKKRRKKKKKKGGHVVGKPLDSFKTVEEFRKETLQKTNANIK